jgi:hypothetical protein
MQRARDIALRLEELAEAWRTTAPEIRLAGMSLEQFQAAALPTRTIREELQQARLEIKGKIAARAAVDAQGRELALRVVAAVIAEATQGPNSPLYRAMNYVTKEERRSGLVRKGSEGKGTAS